MTSPADLAVLARGALVTVDSSGAKTSLPFQYNPDTLRRTIEPNTVGGTTGSRSQAVRFAGAPKETINVECHLSAADALAQGSAVATRYGIGPQLAALALLAYPSSGTVAQAQAMLDLGTIEVIPAIADQLLFVWGSQRVVPCRLVSYTITEQVHDTDLNPVLATVAITLQVLSYSDVGSGNPAYQTFVAYQQNLEQLAALAAAPGT